MSLALFLFQKGKRAVDPNVIIQLFSPLVTSHRFMKEQFGNPYNSVQCEDGTNIVFQDVRFLNSRFVCEKMSKIFAIMVPVHGVFIPENWLR